MEALRALIRGDLPPVGNPILFFGGTAPHHLPVFENYCDYWVDSGTSALGLALLAAKQLRQDVALPEVILPGYCCPDLVAAANYAGVKAVVIDISVDDPSLSDAALDCAINSNTIAVIAVNFFGVKENFQKISRLKINYPQLLIVEDNAQWFPDSNEENDFQSDFVIFSFGRGKPVSLLGGGLLLVKKELDDSAITEHISKTKTPSAVARLTAQLKYVAYNGLLNPRLYQLLSRNPILNLGQTIYHPLTKVTELDDFRKSLVGKNLQQYNERGQWVEFAYDELLLSVGLENSFFTLNTSRRKRLLRYPLLFKSLEAKKKYYPRLVKQGLGATEMYKTMLPSIEGVADKITLVGELPNASSFAERFISLPLHSGVKAHHLDILKAVLQN